MIDTATEWVRRLQLLPHPEGGHYREVYRSKDAIGGEALPKRFGASRSLSTAIYFLLEGSSFSAFHRLKSDELWHHYHGAPVTLHLLDSEKGYSKVVLGGVRNGEWQIVISAECWFAAELEETDSFALVGCTVAPGFDFADFEMARQDDLIGLFPDQQPLISRLTRN